VRHFVAVLGAKEFGKSGIGHLRRLGTEKVMTRQAKIKQLCSTLDAAAVWADEVDLDLVVLLLDMARLEVDQIVKNNVVTMPSSRLLGKQP
jgi:hypothetical protein